MLDMFWTYWWIYLWTNICLGGWIYFWNTHRHKNWAPNNLLVAEDLKHYSTCWLIKVFITNFMNLRLMKNCILSEKCCVQSVYHAGSIKIRSHLRKLFTINLKTKNKMYIIGYKRLIMCYVVFDFIDVRPLWKW